jgi:hypothetical protein
MRRLHGAFHAWKPALTSPLITVQVKRMSYGPNSSNRPRPTPCGGLGGKSSDRATADLITKMDVAMRRLATGSGPASGTTMRFLPSDLLHSDAGARCFRDEIMSSPPA